MEKGRQSRETKAYLVGAGPGAPDLITLRGRKLIEKSDVLIYDALAGEELIKLAPAHCKKIYVGKRAGHHSMKQEEISRLLVEECKPGLTVVRLKGGDSFVFGRGGEEAEALIQAGIDYELVPGVTSAIAAPELFGIPVTHRGVAGSFTVLTGHTKQDGIITEEFDTLAKLSGTIVILMGVKNGGAIAQGLMAAGKAYDTPIAFIENASLPEQKLVRGTLSEVDQFVKEGKVHAPAVLVIGDVAAFPQIVKHKKIAVSGTEHFVKLMQQNWFSDQSDVMLCDAHNLEIRPILEHLPESVKDCNWILFTSGYGVTHFMKLCKKDQVDLRTLHKIRFAVIGKDTGGYLEQYGIYPDFVSKRAEGYAFGVEFAEFIAKEKTQKILLLRAKKASKGLPRALTEKGIDFTDIALYDTFPMRQQTAKLLNELADDNENPAAVVMGSRSAAEALFGEVEGSEQLKQLLRNRKLFGMGNGAKDYLMERGICEKQILIPSAPGIEELVKLIYDDTRIVGVRST